MALLRCKACVLAIVQFAAISGTFASTKSPPYFIEEPSDTYVKKGRPAVLKCQVGGNPKPSIMWKRNGNKLDLTSDSRRTIKPDGSLYFSEIVHQKSEKPDEGTYQCEAFSQISNLDYQIASKTARLIVAGMSSRVTVTPSTLIRIRHRDTARLFCSVKHSAPKAVISWRKRGENETITAGARFTLTPNGALQIRNIRFEEQGQYECIAENTFTAKKHTSTNAAMIEVIGDDRFDRAPSFTVEPQDTVAISGSKVVLECIANGFPKPRVTWLRDGSPVVLGSGYSILGESNLLIESVSVAQAGNYTCQAKSGSLKAEATAKLQVHSPPVFKKTPRAVHAYQHTDVRFECVADGMPKPRITWSKTGDIITNTPFTTVGDGFLLILEVALSDMGSYQCFAENDLGRIQATAELYVYRKGDRIPTTTPPPTTTTPESTTTVSTTLRSTTPKPQVPEKPENVVPHVRSDTEIELTWAPPAVTNGKILHYIIYYNVADGAGPVDFKTVNTSGDNLRVLLSGLKPDTKYRFNVFAKNKQGAGAISDEETATTLSSSQVPGRPLNLVAEAETDSSIRVTWAEPDTGPSSVFRYVIIYKDASDVFGEMQEITKQQTRLLRNLETYTKYIISVYAENKIGNKGASAVTEATTKGGVPRIPPTDFVLKPDNSGRGLIATWKAPDPIKVNGRIAFYIIKFRKVGSQVENTTAVIDADRQSYTIKGLMPSTRYEAKIAAGTNSGLGVYTRNWVKASTNVTECKEDTTPGKPKFNMLKEFSNAILVGWQPPENAGLVCVTGYKIEWGEHIPHQFSVGPLSSDKTQHLIKGLYPKRKYVILLKAVNGNGNGPDIQTEVETSDSKVELEPVKGVQALPVSSKAMRLSWRDTQVSSTVPRIYHVYYALRKKLGYCGNTTEKSIKCSKLKPYTKYTFYVRRNDEAINATVSNFTMEDKPGPPTDLTGDPDEKDFTRLSLHWQPPLELNGHIVKYRIYYSTNVNASLKTWQAVEAEGSKLTKQITGLKPGTAYYFQMQAKTTKGWGPMSEKEEVSTLTAFSLTTVPPSATALSLTPAASEPDAAAQQGAAGLKNKTLWIVIAAVAGITLIAIIIISVILCKKRSGDDIQRKPPTYKSVIQANGSAKKKHKEEKPPDLWINHTENLEMKPVQAVNPAPDVTNTSTIPRSSEEMKPLDDSPLDHIKVDHDRSSFMNGSEADPDDFADLPPPPMIDSKGDPYPEYADETRTPTPPPSPGVSPFQSPRVVTPENVKPPIYPKTSTPRYQMNLPRSGSCDNTVDVADPRPPQRSRSYDPDFRAPSSKVPVYPMLHTSPPATLPKPKPKPPVAPADDIQLPPVGYNRKTPPNGYWTPPPKYEDIFARRSNPPPSPPRDQDAVVADLDKEIAGLEGLMRDLNEITAGDYLV